MDVFLLCAVFFAKIHMNLGLLAVVVCTFDPEQVVCHFDEIGCNPMEQHETN